MRTVAADAVVLATGARERPRPARLIPGDRPDGVYTTGQLQNLVHLHHAEVGTRALIVGGELVSWSAVLTLREAHCATVAMVTDQPRSESYAAFRIPGRTLMDGPVLTRSRLVSIHGKDRVRAAVVENLDTGARTTVECDTVVFTGDWIPDHELARTAGLAMDAGTRGPVVDAALRTSALAFSRWATCCTRSTPPTARRSTAGMWPRGAELAATPRRPEAGLRIRTDGPFRWVAPQLITPNGGSASATTCCSGWTSTAGCRSCARCRTGGCWGRRARRGPPRRDASTARRGHWSRGRIRTAVT